MSLTIGKQAEEIAVAHLARQGHKIVARNWRFRHLEVDVISRHKELLVVTEVKYRKNEHFESSIHAVTRKKQQFLIQAINAYLDTVPDDPEVRFDVIAISGSELTHFEDAFRPY